MTQPADRVEPSALVEAVRRAIGGALQDGGKYGLRMRLSFDEQTRAAEAAIAAMLAITGEQS